MAKRDLYKQKIIDHYKSPRNYGEMEDPDYKAHLSNSVCGDEITIFLKVSAGRVTAVKFKGSGCAISISGASMLSERLIGMSVKEVEKLGKDYVLEMLGMESRTPRLKCATLGLEAVKRAVKMGEDDPCDFC